MAGPSVRDLAGWTHPDDKDEKYLYWSQAHSHIMHRPGPSRKPLVGEKGAPRVIV
jgi:hypothetical protein